MRFKLYGLVEIEIDWKAVAFIALADAIICI